MPVPIRFDDLIVMVPGILGSVLERDGSEIWNHSLSAVRHALPPGRLLTALRLTDEDLGPDGPVRAVRPIGGLHLIPGLWSIDGYRELPRYLRATFDLSRGNLIEFPYDWRLSNAVNARRLATVVEAAHERWLTVQPDARVVFVCHSMGGLLVRYYLEVLGGRERTRTLITLGTPHQGAARAAAVLALGLGHGVRGRLGRLGRFAAVLDELNTVVREFPSVQELLPTYACVDHGDGRLARLADAPLPDLPTAAVQAGARFHTEIARAVAGNGTAPYETHLLGGYLHPTMVTIRHHPDGITPLQTRLGVDHGGDGTVPRFAALPEGARPLDLHALTARHSAMAASPQLHQQLHFALTAIPIRDPQSTDRSLALDLDELVAVDDPCRIETATEEDRLALVATAVHDATGDRLTGPLLRNLGEGRYATELALPLPGAWRVTVGPPPGLPGESVTEIVLAVER